jgi:integrase/recombinase XerD
LILLNEFWNILLQKYYNSLKRNGCYGQTLIPTTQPKIEYLSEGEVDDLLELAGQNNPLYQSYIEILLYTGCRMGELNNLKWGDVNSDLRFIEFSGKTGKRKFPINHQIKSAIKKIMFLQYESLNDMTFFTETDGKGTQLSDSVSAKDLSDENAIRPWDNRKNYILMKYMRQAGLKESYTCHTLRHTFASHLVLHGKPMEQVSKLLGHKSVKTTETFYVHLKPENLTFELPY